MNSVPRQGIKYKDLLWEDRRMQEEDPNQRKRSRGDTDPRTEAGTQDELQFNDQYCQRRKRLRIERVAQEEEAAKRQEVPAQEAAKKSIKKQTKKVSPRKIKQDLQEETKKQEARRMRLRTWLHKDADGNTKKRPFE